MTTCINIVRKNWLVAVPILIMVLFFNTAVFSAEPITLSWNSPSTNADGSPLTDLEGYIVYVGTSPDNYTQNIDVGNTTTYAMNNLTAGSTYYFAVTAYDKAGNESDSSNRESIFIAPPLPPEPDPEPIRIPEITVTDSVTPANDLQLPFGDVTEYNSLDKTVTVRNQGDAGLMINTVSLSGSVTSTFSIYSDSCSFQTVAPSGSCSVIIRFSPSSTGSFSDYVSISSNDSDESLVAVALSGTGFSVPDPEPTGAPEIRVTDSVTPAGDLQLPFGDVTEHHSLDKTMTVTNQGDANLVIDTITLSGSAASTFAIYSDTCSFQTVAPTGSCSVTVRFSPSSTGSFSDHVNIPSNDSDESMIAVALSGTGFSEPAPEPTGAPEIMVTDSATPANDLQLPFGDVTEYNSLDKTVTVRNQGDADLVIGTITLSGSVTSTFDIYSDTCSSRTIVPSGTCSITIRFSPSSMGSFSDYVSISSNDSDESMIAVDLSGTGLSSFVNNPPEEPVLVAPKNNGKAKGKFKWKKSADPDGESVTYELLVCEDPDLTTGCVTETIVASVTKQEVYYAGIGSLGAGVFFSGIVLAVPFSRKKRALRRQLLVSITIAGMLFLTACGGGGGGSDIISGITDAITDGGVAAPDDGIVLADEIATEVSGLRSNIMYYWKVIATDENGGETSSPTWSFETSD